VAANAPSQRWQQAPLASSGVCGGQQQGGGDGSLTVACAMGSRGVEALEAQ